MPDLVVRYIGAPGFLSARSIPSLRLPDDVAVAQLCFGQVALQEPEPEPEPKPKKQGRKLFEPVDLAKEMKAKQAQSEQSGSATDGSPNATLFRWMTYAGIGLLLILAASTIAYIALLRKRGRGSGDDEDEDDEERERERERDRGDADADEVDDKG